MHTSEYKIGNKLSYTKEIMFKGKETVTSKIVGIFPRGAYNVLLLENGDQFNLIK